MEEDEIFEDPVSSDSKKIDHSSHIIQKEEIIVMNPDVEEKMHFFIKNVLMKQEEYERNAFSYLMNL